MDDCLTERLVYSDSENSDEEAQKRPKPPINTYTHQFSSDEDELVDAFPTEDHPKEDLNKSDDDNLVVSKKVKKPKKILSSDDENSKPDSIPDKAEGNESASEMGSTKSDSDQNESNKTSKFKSVIRPSICDSESSSGEDAPGQDLSKKKKMIKKFKKLKEKPKKEKPKKEKLKKEKSKKEKKPKEIASDRSGSESDDDELPKKSSKSANNKKHSGGGLSNSGSSGSDSGSSEEQDENAPVQPREKPVQRMSAKAAEEQMKEIQSESQRLLREAYISVPYHKPKQYSLKEFLSRRSIVQQKEELNNLKPKKAAAAIKMSEEELYAYAKRLEEREKEAVEFFKVDDSDSDSNQNEPTNDTEQKEIMDTVIEPTKNEETNTEPMISATEETNTDIAPTQIEISTALDEAMATTNPAVENMDENSVEEAVEMTESFNVVELHTEKTELDNELDKMIAKDQRKSRLAAMLSITTLNAPKLSGGSGMVIDLETNEMKPKEKSGVDMLVERFAKNAIVKSVNIESQEIGIFHTESGSLETHKLHFNNDDKVPKKEPKPGQSYLKLRSELSRKINEKRREAVYKRLEEEKQQKQTESDEEEVLSDESFEEYSDCEMATENTVAENGESVTAPNENDNENENDIALSGSENEPSKNESSDSEISDNESELCNVEPSTGTKERCRILTALDDDSDGENVVEDDPAVKESQDIQPKVTQNDFVPSDMNRSQDTDEILSFGLFSGSSGTMKAPEAPKLYEDNNEEIGESQLMALCSGTFATQFPGEAVIAQKSAEPSQNMGDLKTDIETSAPMHAILSSDEEEASNQMATEPNDKTANKKKKKKKQALVYSDDEDEKGDQPNNVDNNSDQSEEDEEPPTNMEDLEVEDEENVPEKYVEYDSDENEIEVVLEKNDVRKKASNFFENEAELSESEWGSDDEDEKDTDNQYEKELGDTDVFDESKIHSELERIRLRQQIDQDAREIRILTEQYIEEEDDGHERERKFRWKHLNNTDINDQSQSADQEPENSQIGSDDENEEEWRRQRYEREQKLKEQPEKSTTFGAETTEANISTSTINGNVSVSENTSIRRISITKPLVKPKISSPFLINSTALTSGHLSRKSFLNRDTTTLAKLAGLTKTGSDGDAIINTKKKGNYVFIATEKKNDSKRKSDCEMDNNGASSTELSNPRKKSKLATQTGQDKIRPQTKTFLDLLSK